MSDIYKYELTEGKKFSNDAGEAETLDAYQQMMAGEKEAALKEQEEIKNTLTENTKFEWEKLQSNLLENITAIRKFIVKHDLRNDDIDKALAEAEDTYKNASEKIVESIIEK
jgi:hypothetical protein